MAIRAKKYSTSFKVILIMLVLIVAGYAFKVLTTGTKQKMVADTGTDTVTATQPIKHKRKHHIKKQVVLSVTAIPADTQKIVKADKTEPAVANPTQPPTSLKTLPATIVADSVKANNNYLYTTYVQPNITGIVKLRAQDKFNAVVLADIPARSNVQVLARGVTYYKVAYNNAVGFVPKWALNIR